MASVDSLERQALSGAASPLLGSESHGRSSGSSSSGSSSARAAAAALAAGMSFNYSAVYGRRSRTNSRNHSLGMPNRCVCDCSNQMNRSLDLSLCVMP